VEGESFYQADGCWKVRRVWIAEHSYLRRGIRKYRMVAEGGEIIELGSRGELISRRVLRDI